MLGNLQLEEKIGLEITEHMAEIFTVLKEPSQATPGEMKKKVQPLIGRGQGLTPSGDDILMGYLVVYKAYGHTHVLEEFLKSLPLNKKTTEVSTAYYQALFAGSISSLFHQLFLTSEKEDETAIQEIIRQIGQYGHTSGYDTLFGMYLGLQSVIQYKKVYQNQEGF